MDVIELFIKLLESKSETPSDGGLLDFVSEYLEGFESKRIDVNGVKNLFIYKKFGSSDEHLCFAGHVDVVPSGDAWDSDPYKVKIDGDTIYARGTQDMKSGVAAFTQALKETKNFDGILSILLTSDEEGEAKYGTLEVLKYLKEVDMIPTSCIVAEPTCEKVFGDAIKVGRRGSINGVIVLKGKQGHAAYPEKAINPVNLIAHILPKIAGYKLDNGDKYFSSSTFVITDIRAGMEVTNVTPGSLKMMFNVRNSTNTDQKSIKNFIEFHFKDLDYSLELSQSAYPFVTDAKTKIVKKLDESINRVMGIKTKHSTAGGTSDARYIAPCGVDVVEFGVVNDSIHAPNENTKLSYIKNLKSVFLDLIENYNKN